MLPLILAPTGPALCAVMPDVILSPDELATLLQPNTSSAPATLRGRHLLAGGGLASAFAVTDVPHAVSGGSLCMWDPCGAHLVTTAAEQRAALPRARCYR